MQPFSCGHCGQTVYFDNDRCYQCGSALGYLPGQRRMVAMQTADGTAADAPLWLGQGPDDGRNLAACLNRQPHVVCNWLLDEGDPQPLCRSCRLTAFIPNLNEPANLRRWRVMERAKRRAVYTLLALGLPPEPKQGPDDPWGLSFELLASHPGAPPVMTGHERGVITLNIAEADDLTREETRVAMGEPVRTLLGHVRHEVSHYLQYRYLQQGPPADICRDAFGDERSPYALALASYHASGPPADWRQHFISAYASAHPWEDWAETCAHYLLITDAVETAARWGLQLQRPDTAGLDAGPGVNGDLPGVGPVSSLGVAQGPPSDMPVAPASALGSSAAEAQAGGPVAAVDVGPQVAHLVLEQWLPVARFVNAMNRSMGTPDSYPYLMPNPVLQKMTTVAQLLHQAAQQTQGV